jgi:uncharacterized protein YacL
VTQKLFLEIIVFLIVGLRIYYLQQNQIKSIGDKLFALYKARFLPGGWGYIILFYSAIITLILLGASIESLVLAFFAIFDAIVIYKLILSISVKTDDKEEFYSLLLTRFNSPMTYQEAKQLKEYLTKPSSILLLYIDEFIFFLTTIWIIEVTGG